MKRVSVGAAGLCAVLFCSVLPAPAQQQSAAQKATQKAKKAITRFSKRATTVTKKAARNTAAFAKKMATTPKWPRLSLSYNYDSSTPPNVKEQPIESGDVLKQRLTFTGPSGKPVQGIFIRPKADGVYPCALVLHGLTNNKEIAVKMFGNQLLEKGFALLALDAPEHGKNQPASKSYWNKRVITVAVHEGVRNYRRILDYLSARPDIDKERIGLVGYSLGSITGSILGSVDDRVKAFAFCVGGDPFLPIARVTPNDQQREAIFEVSPSLYVGHIAPRPVWMANGKTDAVIVLPAAKLLQDAAMDPKEVVWYDGGHDVPAAIRQQAVDWLTAKIKGE